MNIQYSKWNKKDMIKLNNSFRLIMNTKEPQLYYPTMSLFFYIHNTYNSHRTIDFKRNNYIKEILSIDNSKEYNSNIIVNAKVINKMDSNETQIKLFCKTIPLLDPVHYLLNNYSFTKNRNPFLPSNYNFNTITKINDMNNMAYIDVFFSFLVSKITESNKNPSFPIYYGSINGLGNYKYDISDDIDEFENHEGFHKVNRFIDIEEFYNDCNSTDSDSDSYSDSYSNSESESQNKSDNDYIANFKDFPIIHLFIETLDGTLEDIIQNEMNLELLRSCLFQVTFALIYLQKHYYFTHNDLHINNIMYIKTDKPFLYYKYNNQYFKIPTFGKLFKIIDFGRSIFTFRKKTYMNDVFSKYGEAEGQYTHPPQVSFLKTEYKDMVYPSYHFDLCRLAITMIDEIRYNHDDDLEDEEYYQNFLDFLKFLVTDKNGTRLDKEKDNFDLYIKISRDACNCLPREVIVNPFFHCYRVKKKQFPKSTYYSV
jgi:hypothetical protein